MSRYEPSAVPADYQSSFLQAELQRLADAVNSKPDRAFGGLIQRTGPTPIALTGTPIIFNPYTDIVPLNAPVDGVSPDLATGQLEMLTGGIYSVNFFSLDDSVANNTAYTFEPYRNGAPVGITIGLDPSNQTDRVPVSLASLITVDKGDIIDIRASSSPNRTWDARGSRFYLSRISDSFD